MKENLLDNLKGKKKVVAIAAIALCALAIIAAVAMAMSGVGGGGSVYKGYLICQNCGSKGVCMAGKLDLTVHPEQYTLDCAKMPECITSGYGIAVAGADGKYEYIPFDARGSQMALNDIIYASKKPDHLLVEVRGARQGYALAVDAIAEK